MLRNCVRNHLLCAALLSAAWAVSAASAAEPKTELLWPAGAPGANGTEAKDKPTLIIYLPEAEKANGCAIVVCPGGGYGGLAMGHEGHDIGKWLNSLGIAAFICDYRHRGKGYGHPAPLDDAQRAIRTVRARAKEFNVDPQRVGVLGFSAGGHLASTVATHFEDRLKGSSDSIDMQSNRPDFAVLCYAVIAFDADYTHKGSQINLLGKDAPKELVESLSNEKQVTKETPPTFLWHTTEDTAVPPQNSVYFYLACLKHKVPAELHIYEKGPHGIGLAQKFPGADQWPKQLELWLGNRGMLKK
jgi:acetyl esterase/lipase